MIQGSRSAPAPSAAARAPTGSALRRASAEIGAEALRGVGLSKMSSVAYDSGFLARLLPLFPKDPSILRVVRYLESTQDIEGYWGSPLPNLHDRTLSTLSALAGLVRAGEPTSSPRVERALDWLGHCFPRLSGEPQLVGSDLLLPPLAEKCSELGLDVDPKALPYRR